MSQSVDIAVVISSFTDLIQGISELKMAHQDMRELEAEKRMMKNCHGQKVQIDYLIKNELGEEIGVTRDNEGKIEFVVEKETASVKETINKVAQAYSRIKILNEVKKKGYKSVKEEKLANGSIRLVVEKWR